MLANHVNFREDSKYDVFKRRSVAGAEVDNLSPTSVYVLGQLRKVSL